MARPLNLHLQQLAYLVEVADGATVRAAAERLRVSQPALSQGLKELERRLNVTLFEKVGRRLVLTQDGHEVALVARAILAQAVELARARAGLVADDDGHLGQGRCRCGLGDHRRDHGVGRQRDPVTLLRPAVVRHPLGGDGRERQRGCQREGDEYAWDSRILHQSPQVQRP